MKPLRGFRFVRIRKCSSIHLGNLWLVVRAVDIAHRQVQANPRRLHDDSPRAVALDPLEHGREAGARVDGISVAHAAGTREYADCRDQPRFSPGAGLAPRRLFTNVVLPPTKSPAISVTLQ